MGAQQRTKTDRVYTFRYVEKCNMCGSESSTHKILGRRLSRSQGKNPRNKIGVSTTVVRCSNCGLVYANPLPIPASVQDHYGVLPELYWNEEYFSENEDYFKDEIQTLKSLTAFKDGDKALDIGAGLGKGIKALSRAGFDAYGIEPSRQFYDAAIERNRISPGKLTLNSIETARFPKEHFDFITFGAVLEHLYDPSESIRCALGWLKREGIMHVEVPSSDWLVNRLLNAFYRIQGLDYVANISPMHEPFHLYEFSLASFQEHAGQNGYEIIRHDHYVCKTFLPRILDLAAVPYMRMTGTGMQLCVWLKKK